MSKKTVRYYFTPKGKGWEIRSEMVPKKPKMVRIKAWACFSYGDTCALSVRSGPYQIPCTILIGEKHLKGREK